MFDKTCATTQKTFKSLVRKKWKKNVRTRKYFSSISSKLRIMFGELRTELTNSTVIVLREVVNSFRRIEGYTVADDFWHTGWLKKVVHFLESFKVKWNRFHQNVPRVSGNKD